MLENIIEQLEMYDISTFKQRMRDIMLTADNRAIEDQTDFQFLKRRADDNV